MKFSNNYCENELHLLHSTITQLPLQYYAYVILSNNDQKKKPNYNCPWAAPIHWLFWQHKEGSQGKNSSSSIWFSCPNSTTTTEPYLLGCTFSNWFHILQWCSFENHNESIDEANDLITFDLVLFHKQYIIPPCPCPLGSTL